MRILAAFVGLRRRTVAVRMGGVLLAFGAALVVGMVVLGGAILVMSECHALPRHDRRDALHRDGQRQQQDSKKSEESFRHQQAL